MPERPVAYNLGTFPQASQTFIARVVVTCTGYNVSHLPGLCPELPDSHIKLVHHGVDVDAASRIAEQRDVGAGTPPVILAAWRLVDKKGFDTLIDARAALRGRGVSFACRTFGTDPLMTELRRRVEAAGLAASVDLPGWAPAGQLLDEMGRAVVFAMPSRVAVGGDRDGIPNVVLEAMAAGLLVEPDDVTVLAGALERVLIDAALSARFGAAARARIREEFTLEVASSHLIALFGSVPAADLR